MHIQSTNNSFHIEYSSESAVPLRGGNATGTASCIMVQKNTGCEDQLKEPESSVSIH